METIKARIYDLIRYKLGVDEAVLTDDADFYNDLGVDSLDFIELIGDVEKEFNMVIEEEVYAKFKTVGALVKFTEQKAGVLTPEATLV